MIAPKVSAIRQTLWQSAAIVAMACIIALLVNHQRPDSIPVIGDWSSGARFPEAAKDGLLIEVIQAKVLFESGDAVFIDARPEALFMEGHIQGALNIPWQDVDRYFAQISHTLDAKNPIITYCDGEGCELGYELALFLRQMGFENVRVLVGGWSAWRKAGLPTDVEH